MTQKKNNLVSLQELLTGLGTFNKKPKPCKCGYSKTGYCENCLEAENAHS